MLKSLEVYGFKSFADRTTFAFAPGITCVVGPNGSGKSNVVDAMKWLLGDQSPKSLRGKNMADVIFNGSRSRKPSGFAEATLTFDNTHRILQTEFDEVRITRRLYQGGDSEYLINGETSRLKDIRELFMGTGAATSAYSIIEQGRVGQVLQGNPSTRRILFDEAAGISRFKSRRLDAERKLERVSQNLLRLTDIVDEVETQLNACRNQAGKAAKFRDFSRSYDALWLGMAADDSRRLHQQLSELRKNAAHLTGEVNTIKTEQQTIEDQREQLRLEFTAADEELQLIESKLSTLMQQRSSLQTSLHHQSDRAREIEQECETLRKQRAELKRRVQEIEREIQAVQEQCEQAQQAVEQKQRERQTDEVQLEEVTRAIEQHRQQRTDLAAQLQDRSRNQAAAENHLQHLNSRRETLGQAKERIQAEIQEFESEIAQKQQVVDQADAVYQAGLATFEEHKQHHDQIATRRSDIKHEMDSIHARLRADREQRSAWEARLGLLEDMEKRQLGLSLGVQEILQRAQRSPLSPWKHVLGILPDFLDCDLEYAPLIEIALGGGSNFIVVDQLQPFVEYLERGETQFEGRLSFLELPQGKAGTQSELTAAQQEFLSQLETSEQVLSRADHLIRCEDLYRPLFERLLGNTWIVDRLTTARKLSLVSPLALQFLTLQGDLLDRDGQVQTGTLQPEGSVVSRRSEIRRIKTELQSLDRHIHQLNEKTGELSRGLIDLEEALSQAQGEVETQAQEVAELKQHLVAARTDHKQSLKEHQRLTGDRDTIQQQLQKVAEEIEQEHQQLANYQTELDTLRQQTVELEERLQQHQQRKQELLNGRSQFQLELAKVEERLAASESVLARLRKERQLRIAQYQEAVSRLEQTLTKQSRLDLQILNAQSRLAELYLIGEQLQVDVAQARKIREHTQEERDRLNEQLRGLNEVRRTHEEQLQDARIELRDLENELHTLAEKIYEDYQLTLRELILHGISALTPYLTLRKGEEIAAVELPERQRMAKPAEETPTEQDETAETAPAPESTPATSRPDAERLKDFTGIEAVPCPWEKSETTYEEARGDIDREVQRLRKKIKALGAVDPDSLKGLDELEFRFKHLNTQLQDLKHAQATLQDIIRKINVESRRIFIESFNTIRVHFQELFRQLFGGGEGDVMMEDESDPLECGIEIVARPPGKELRSISLLSGGEKTMTAVGLLLAIFKSRPSPFCILDEVDAALDEANIDRFASVIGLFQDKTQFIVISHRKRTMTAADRIFGVTMEEAGVSKRLTVRFEDVGENGEIKTSSDTAAA